MDEVTSLSRFVAVSSGLVTSSITQQINCPKPPAQSG